MSRYPNLEVNLKYLGENVRYVADRCRNKGIEIAGVVKGTTGIPQCIQAFADNGAVQIASSRLEQLETAKNMGLDLPLMLIRIPMLSEVKDVIRLAQISLNSEIKVIEALNEEAGRQGVTHKVILMADLGDLREGFWDKEEMIETAVYIENQLDNIELAGVGTNLGCYGSILATEEKLDELVVLADRIETRIGRPLEYVSGGATSSFMRVIDGDIPARVNHLRIGEGILLARDLNVYYGYDMSEMHQDVYTLKAELVEMKEKPTYPVGQMAVDAFGKTPEYTDRGVRLRGILAVGKVDIGSIDEIFPRLKGVEIVGGSSDHTLIDLEDVEEELQVGDILDFDIDYASLVYLTSSENIKITFVE